MSLTPILVVFGVVFIAELPDKSMLASLALSTRFRKSYVWLGAAAALLVQVLIAVTAGHFMTLLPHRLLALVVGLLFLLGAGLLIFQKDEGRTTDQHKLGKGTHGFIQVFATSFIVIFLSEWGDITQIVTANYAAKYHDALGVGIGATAALWTVAALGVLLGSKLIKRVPGRTLQRAAAVILLIFAVISLAVAL